MGKLDVKAATVSGAVASGIIHALLGLGYLGAPNMMAGAYTMMMYNSVQFGMGSFSLAVWVLNILLGAIIGAIIGYLIAVSYNWASK